VQLVLIITKVMSSNPARGEVYLMQLDVINFVNDFLQVCGFSLPDWVLPQQFFVSVTNQELDLQLIFLISMI
jgi:hypothetical protein